MTSHNVEAIHNDEEIIEFLSSVAPDQCEFITGKLFVHGKHFSFGVRDTHRSLTAVIRFCEQYIGDEQKAPRIEKMSDSLREAKIIAFAVHPEHQNKGIGKDLQRKVLQFAEEIGCYQVASYSTYDKKENYSVKIALGFAAQPEVQPDGTKGCYFLKVLDRK